MQRKITEKQLEQATKLAVDMAKSGNVQNLEILEEAKELKRLNERAGLRHKHTSTAVRDKKRYEKWNESEREAQNQREMLYRELVQKGKTFVEDDVKDEEVIPGEEKEKAEENEKNKVNKEQKSLETVRALFEGDEWVGKAKNVKNLIDQAENKDNVEKTVVVEESESEEEEIDADKQELSEILENR